MTENEVYLEIIQDRMTLAEFKDWVTNETHKVYDSGYDEGYSDGYNCGYDEGVQCQEVEADEHAYNEGYADGRAVTIEQFKDKK
jgi:flagellar biosynthesis/type III secretory pathway protein FliH